MCGGAQERACTLALGQHAEAERCWFYKFCVLGRGFICYGVTHVHCGCLCLGSQQLRSPGRAVASAPGANGAVGCISSAAMVVASSCMCMEGGQACGHCVEAVPLSQPPGVEDLQPSWCGDFTDFMRYNEACPRALIHHKAFLAEPPCCAAWTWCHSIAVVQGPQRVHAY